MRFFIPALLAILFHLSFLLFKKASPVISDRSPLKQVMLLSQSGETPDEQRLLAWMNILDAEHTIQPDRKYGFSVGYQPPPVEDLPLDLKNLVMNDDDTVADFLPVPWQDTRSRFRHLWRRPLLNVSFVNPADYKLKLDWPAWLDEEEQVLPQLFDNPNEIREQVRKNPPPHHETVLRVTFLEPDVFPKVDVVYSCGDPSLDLAAVKTLTVKSENSPISTEKHIIPYFVTVKWCSD